MLSSQVKVRKINQDAYAKVSEKSGLQCEKTLATNAQAGQLKHHKCEWQKITQDRTILDIVTGYEVDFVSPPVQTGPVGQPKFTKMEAEALDTTINELLRKKVIAKCTREQNEFVSPVFLRPKKNGKYRLILNLKKVNEYILPIHFKMDTIQSCINLIERNCHMASLDLTDAYYSVSIHPNSQKYLKFKVGGQLYKYITLPNGLSSAPRIFTKLTKPVYSTLRTRGHISSGYLDDSFLLGRSYDQCLRNVNDTYNLFTSLGFQISMEKSIPRPTQEIEHLDRKSVV